jgi:hypothetical protein
VFECAAIFEYLDGNMNPTRYYEVHDKWGPDSRPIVWGLSRFGKRHDAEMSDAVSNHHTPGDGKSFCVGFTPEMPRIHTAARVRSQRIRNMQKRVAKFPLFADQFEAEEMRDPYFSLDDAEKSQEHRRVFSEQHVAQFWSARETIEKVELG